MEIEWDVCFAFFNDGIMGYDIGVSVPRDSNQTWMPGKCPKHVLFFVCFFFAAMFIYQRS